MSPSDQCRLCSCNFKVKFGNLNQTSYISTENLFNPSQILKSSLQSLRSQDSKSWITPFIKKSIEGEISKSTPANKSLLDTPEGRSPIRKSVRVFSPVTKRNNGKSPRKTLKFWAGESSTIREGK